MDYKTDVRAVGEIVASGVGACAGASLGAKYLATDGIVLDSACCIDGSGVVDCTASADLREAMDRLVDLVHVEEGAIRHVVLIAWVCLCSGCIIDRSTMIFLRYPSLLGQHQHYYFDCPLHRWWWRWQ